MFDDNFKEHCIKILKASYHNDVDFIRNLKKIYPELDWKLIRQKKIGTTALHCAAEGGHLDLVKYLLNEFETVDGKKDVDIRSTDCRTPLHCAAQFSRYKIVEYLVQNGADVNAVKQGDWNPLMLACTKTGEDAFSTISCLVLSNADLSHRNRDGWTPLMLACREGDLKIVTFLANASPDCLKICSNNRRFPLHTACLHGHLSVVDELYNRNSEILHEKDSCGSTPFHDAVLSGNIDLIKYLVSKEVNVFETNAEGWNALHIAANVGNNDIVQYLINDLNFDPNCLTTNAITPLHCAARSKRKDTMDLLIQLKADETICDKFGRTALEYFQSN